MPLVGSNTTTNALSGMTLFFLLLLLSSFSPTTCRDATCGDTEGDFLLEEVECSKTIPTAMAYSASPRPVVLRNCSSDWTAQSKWQSMAFLGDKLGQLEAHYVHSGPRFIWSDAGREMGQVLGLDVQSPHNIAEGVEAATFLAQAQCHDNTPGLCDTHVYLSQRLPEHLKADLPGIEEMFGVFSAEGGARDPERVQSNLWVGGKVRPSVLGNIAFVDANHPACALLCLHRGP